MAPFGKTSPIFSYPYARSREALAALAKNGDPDACHGWKMQFINPLTGGPAMPTIGAFIQLLPKGFRSRPYRSTDAHRVLGRRRQRQGAHRRRDLRLRAAGTAFVVPSWQPVRFEAKEECVLFSYSDRSAQLALGLWREQRD